MSQRTRSGWFSVSQIAPSPPPTSSSTTTITSRSPRAGAPALPRERDRGRHLGGGLRLHVQRAAAPQLAVDDVAAPWVVPPLGRVGEHGVDVGEQSEHRTVGGAAQARHEVRALRRACRRASPRTPPPRAAPRAPPGRPLVPRRVDGVVADELREQPGRLLLQVPSDDRTAPPDTMRRTWRGNRSAWGRCCGSGGAWGSSASAARPRTSRCCASCASSAAGWIDDARVRGRQRRDAAAPRPRLHAAVDLLRAARGGAPGQRSSAGSRSSSPAWS